MIKNGHLSAVSRPTKSGPASSIRQATSLIGAAVLFSVVTAYPQAPTPEARSSLSPEEGELQQVTVTGYLISRVGERPQPVSNYDQNYTNKTGEQTVSETHRQRRIFLCLIYQ